MRRQRIDALPKKFGGEVGVERMVRVVLEENHAGLGGRRLAYMPGAGAGSMVAAARSAAANTMARPGAVRSTPESRIASSRASICERRHGGRRPADGTRHLQRAASGTLRRLRKRPDLSRARCPAVPRRYAVIQQARHAHAHVTGTPPRSHVCCPPVGHTRFQSRHSRMLMITLCFGGIEDRAEGDGPLGADGTCCLNPQRGPQNTKTNG